MKHPIVRVLFGFAATPDTPDDQIQWTDMYRGFLHPWPEDYKPDASVDITIERSRPHFEDRYDPEAWGQ